MYTYNAKVLRVIDRDTLELLIDMGMDHWMRKRVKFSDVDQQDPYAYPLTEDEQTEANYAQTFVENVLAFSLQRKTTLAKHLDHPDVIVKTNKKGCFDHYMATVHVIGDLHGTVGERLKRAGF